MSDSILRTSLSGLCACYMFTENVLSANPTVHELGFENWEIIVKEDIDFS